MNAPQLMTVPGVYVEIGANFLKALQGERGLELPLERQANGRLTEACRTLVIRELQEFLQRKVWQPRAKAFCAIGARGVSLRRIALPAAAREEFQRLLRLQIESEFPLSPDELAWGYQTLGETRNGTTRQELLVVAVKKEVVAEYSELLSRCGANPVFTPAALARSVMCPPGTGSAAILDVGRASSEFVSLENGVPAALRVLPLGEEQLNASTDALESLVKSMNGKRPDRLFISGSSGLADISPELGRRLGGVACEPLKVAPGPGHSAAVLGLKRAIEHDGGRLLMLQSRLTDGKSRLAHPASLKLAAIAVALALGVLLLPYVEAILFKPMLAKRIAAIKAQSGRLDTIDRELNFLQFLKQNQPPYLDALFLFAKFRPDGTRIESLVMNRRGEVSFRGSMRAADQVYEFRSKLIDSGFFSSVAVEEQAPTPDRQKVNVRMTALWKPLAERQSLAIGPTADEIEKSKNRKDAPGGGMPGGFSPGAMPMGLPPGAVVSEGMPSPSGPRPPRTRAGGPPAGATPATPSGMRIELPPGAELPPGFTPPPGVIVMPPEGNN